MNPCWVESGAAFGAIFSVIGVSELKVKSIALDALALSQDSTDRSRKSAILAGFDWNCQSHIAAYKLYHSLILEPGAGRWCLWGISFTGLAESCGGKGETGQWF